MDIYFFLRNNKHGENGITNFLSLTMLNAELKILNTVLGNRLPAVLDHLIPPKQTYYEWYDDSR